jgi:hypothetical protein
MKNLIAQFKKTDSMNKGGIIFIAAFIIPCLIAVLNDLLINGSNLL